MAKKENIEEKVQASEEAVVTEGTQEGTQQQSEGADKEPKEPKESKKPNKEATISNGVKKVKIRTTEPIDAIIAGVPYVFQENKEVQVPTDVAAILVNGRKAYRI